MSQPSNPGANRSSANDIAVAQLGARMHYAVPAILSQAGRLSHLYTDFFITHRIAEGLAKLVRHRGLLARVTGRSCEGIPDDRVHSNPWLAWRYYARRRSAADVRKVFLWVGEQFQNWVLRKLAGQPWPTAVYAFDTAAATLFEEARHHKCLCILEQTIAPAGFEIEVLASSRERFPEWATPDDNSEDRRNSQQEIAFLQKQEWALADKILCGSSFLSRLLIEQGVPSHKVQTLPYGYLGEAPTRPHEPNGEGPLRVLFAGSIGLRKGVPSLVEAARLCGDMIHVTLAGSWESPADRLRDLPPNVTWAGPVPRSQMAALYQASDVFALPSLCEGSATVCYEATMHGLPLVLTENAGFPVDHRINGMVVPPDSPQELAKALRSLAADRDLLRSLSQSTWARRGEFSFEAYGRRLLIALDGRLTPMGAPIPAVSS